MDSIPLIRFNRYIVWRINKFLSLSWWEVVERIRKQSLSPSPTPNATLSINSSSPSSSLCPSTLPLISFHLISPHFDLPAHSKTIDEFPPSSIRFLHRRRIRFEFAELLSDWGSSRSQYEWSDSDGYGWTDSHAANE